MSEVALNSNLTRRANSQGGEDALYKRQSPAGHGEIELVDYMGNDEMVARVATAGHGIGIFKERLHQRDFLGHLVASGIYDPFSAVQLKFSMQMPIREALTFVYDRSGSVNEYSGRYSEMINSARVPSLEAVSTLVENPDKAREIQTILADTRRKVRGNYDSLLAIDFARELARTGLGTNNDTRFYWLMDLPSLASFVSINRLKLDKNDPTREYVECIFDIAGRVAPDTWATLMNTGDKLKLNLTMPSDEEVVDVDLNPSSWSQNSTRRVIVPEVEAKLFALNKFLDHGQFQVTDYMGDDAGLAQAARASYGKGTVKVSEDRGLIRTLVRDAHTSPIEMARLAFESRTPIFTDPRQAARHRTLKQHGFMGYTPVGSLFYNPADSEMKYQDRVNRQGRGKSMEEEHIKIVRKELGESVSTELDAVKRLRGLGAPEDLVREVKGVGFHTRRWRVGDTHNLGHFLDLRLDAHAQMEVRAYAEQVEDAVKAHTPIAYQAIRDYKIDGMRLSAQEIELLKQKGIPTNLNAISNPEFFLKVSGFALSKDGILKLSREGEGFQKKLKRLIKEQQ